MKKNSLFVLLLLAMAPLAAQAADFDYNYVEGGYLSENPSGGGSDLNGVLVDGSYSFQPNWRVIGLFSSASCCGVTDTRYDVGAGYYTSLNEKFDFIADLSFLGQNLSGGGGSHNGWGVDAGFRFMPAEQFEVDATVQHSDVNSNTENTLAVKGLYSFTKNWSVMASFSNNSDEDDFLLGVRYAF